MFNFKTDTVGCIHFIEYPGVEDAVKFISYDVKELISLYSSPPFISKKGISS